MLDVAADILDAEMQKLFFVVGVGVYAERLAPFVIVLVGYGGAPAARNALGFFGDFACSG